MIIVIIIIVIIIKTRINKIKDNNNNTLIRKSISYTEHPLPEDRKRAYPKKTTSGFLREFLNSLPVKIKQSLTCQW